jgi:hypothetical protein
MRHPAVLRAVVLAALLLLPATPAVAAESAMPTRQASAFGMDWVPYIDPADLPPVEQRKAVCLVDTGVAVTPDLPEDRPEGPVVARLAVDGGSGLPGDGPEHSHGTTMASVAGAVAGNDWGTVGAWPAVRIVSMRAMDYDKTVFTVEDWLAAMVACRQNADEHNIAVVNLSLGAATPLSAGQRPRLEDYTTRMHNGGMSVLVSAGNSGAALNGLATVSGVVPVAAGNTSGPLCTYASYATGVLVGPGCGIDISWEGQPALSDRGGSSSATVFASTLVALLRTLRPDSSWQDAERWVTAGAATAASLPRINGEAAARAAGLGAVVDRARARMPRPPAAILPGGSNQRLDAPPVSVGDEVRSGRLPRPRATAHYAQRSLNIQLRNVVNAVDRISVAARVRLGGRSSWRRVVMEARSKLRWRLQRAPQRVRLRYLPFDGDTFAPSPGRTLIAQRGGSFR